MALKGPWNLDRLHNIWYVLLGIDKHAQNFYTTILQSGAFICIFPTLYSVMVIHATHILKDLSKFALGAL